MMAALGFQCNMNAAIAVYKNDYLINPMSKDVDAVYVHKYVHFTCLVKPHKIVAIPWPRVFRRFPYISGLTTNQIKLNVSANFPTTGHSIDVKMDSYICYGFP